MCLDYIVLRIVSVGLFVFLSSLGILAMLADTGSLPKVGYLSGDHYNTSCYKTFKGSVGVFFSFFLIYQQNKR